MSKGISFTFDTLEEMKDFIRNINIVEQENDPDEDVSSDSDAPSISQPEQDSSLEQSTKATANYYDSLHHIYHFNGEIYGEGAIIWSGLQYRQYKDTTFQYDPGDTTEPQIVPLDTSKLNRHEPRVTLELDYQSAFRLAQTKSEPGLVLICRNGKFYVPCTGFYDSDSQKTEYLINLFNVKSCLETSRELWSMLIVGIGNISAVIPFKYSRGTEIDWHAVINYLIETANTYEDELPPVKLFNDAEDNFAKPEPLQTKASKSTNLKKSRKSQQSNQTES